MRPEKFLEMIDPHRKIVWRTISRGKDPNNKNEPYTGRSTFLCSFKLYFIVIREKGAFVPETSAYARAATSDIGKHEKRSSPKTLSLDIMFARPAKRYQNATARQPPNAATDERKLSGKIASTRRQWREGFMYPQQFACRITATESRLN